jgi:hypothetical protein
MCWIEVDEDVEDDDNEGGGGGVSSSITITSLGRPFL